ncbi:hypothetical protein D3C71_1193080 [compost metagenome]
MAIVVASGKVHAGVDARGVFAQGPVHDADGLHEVIPVCRRQGAQAADAVADGNLIRRLLLVFGDDHLLNGQIGLGKPLFEPCQRQGQRRAVALETPRQFRDE